MNTEPRAGSAPDRVAIALPLRRVLVIDDSAIDAELLTMRLHTHYPGLEEVRWIDEPGTVEDEVATFRPDIVITDYHMPGYDVIATVAGLRRRWPTLPVLVMSGLVGEETAIQVLKAGANDFLPKSRSERLPIVIDRELAEARSLQAQARLSAELEDQLRVNRAIFDQAPAGLWMMSAEGVVERANRQGELMMGGVQHLGIEGFASLVGWWADSGERIGPHDWPGARAFEHHEHVSPRLMRVRTFTGEERCFSSGAAPLLADDGSSLGAVISAMDMTAEVELRERLRNAEERLRRLSLNQSILHERQMAAVSRELHDDLGQVLSLLKLHLGSASRTDTPPERRAQDVSAALPLVDLALGRLREVCSHLWPSELSDFGLGPALVSLCSAAARASEIEVSAVETGEPRALDSILQLGLFRVAQQALTNALRHADAGAVRIALCWLAGAVELVVSDDGVGFDAEGSAQPSQQGLRGMRERMELLGGVLQVESAPGGGTTVRASVPAGHEPGAAR